MSVDRSSPIGVFDSGVGGLTVAREIMRNLPSEKIVYFGDTARVPYGSKSRETIIRYSRQIIRFLESQKVKAIVVACNTVSAVALEEIEKEVDVPIHRDDKLADTLSRLEIGDMIPPELYEVVAEILIFVDSMDKIKNKLK